VVGVLRDPSAAGSVASTSREADCYVVDDGHAERRGRNEKKALSPTAEVFAGQAEYTEAKIGASAYREE
jgi:hypothetical protein